MREEKLKASSITKNFIFNSLLTISNMVFPIITFPYVSRILGPEGTGKVEFATSIVYYFNMFAQLGIPTYGIKICAKVRDDREQLSRITQELLILNILMATISYIALYMCLLFIPKFAEEKTLLFFISSTIFLSAVGMEWLYKGLEKYMYITIRSVIFKFIALIAMFALIHSKTDYVLYGCITVFASSASYVTNFLYAKNYIDFKRRKLEFRYHLKPILIFLAMAIASTIYTNLDIMMLGFMKTTKEVGVYNAAIKIRKLLLGFVTALSTVILPRASYYIEHKELNKFYNIAKKAFKFVTIISLGISIYFILFAKEGIMFLSGKEYSGSIIPMQIIMPTLFLVGLTNISGIQMLIPLGKENIVLYSEIAGAIVDIIVNMILIPKYASVGAAIGTLMAEIFVLLVQFFCIKKDIKKIFKGFNWWIIILSLFISSMISLIIKFLNISSNFLILVFSSCIFFTIYFLMLNVFKEPLICKIEKDIIIKIRNKLL